jgi:flagellar motor switch protein FliM
MADDVLSVAERETLLAATISPAAPGGCSISQPSLLPRNGSSDWCFSAPPLHEELKSAVSQIGQDWARGSAAELSSLLRRSVHVELATVVQVTYREFAARVVGPTCFNLLNVAPLEQHWMLEVGPAILHPAIDCMLGGGRNPAPIAARSLTDIELRLACRVTNLLVRELQAAWRPIVEFGLAVERVTNVPEPPPTVDFSDPIVWMRFEINLAGVRGAFNLAIPAASIARVFRESDGEPDPKGAPSTQAVLPTGAVSPTAVEATVELVARLAQSTIAAEEVSQLSVGDMITTGQPVDAPIAVFEEGVLRFHAHTGSLDGHKAVEIENVALPPENDAAAKP